MLKVILHHWHAQRQRPEPTVPIFNDELIVTKVNPIFDEEPAENGKPAEPLNEVESEENRRRLYASGFDSIDSRNDDPGTIVTDVVAEVHQALNASVSSTTTADSALPESKSDDSTTSPDTSPKGKKSKKVNGKSNQSPQENRSSFLHSKFSKQPVVRKKEPKRTSILDFPQKKPTEESSDVTVVKEIDKVLQESEIGLPETANAPVSIPETVSVPETANVENVSVPETANVLVPEVVSVPEKVPKSESIQEPINPVNEEIVVSEIIAPPPPPFPEPVASIPQDNSTTVQDKHFKKSAELKPSAFKYTPKPPILVKIDEKKTINHGELVKSVIMNNLILKPSEIAKRERELRAAAKNNNSSEPVTKTLIKSIVPLTYSLPDKKVATYPKTPLPSPPPDEEISITPTPKQSLITRSPSPPIPVNKRPVTEVKKVMESNQTKSKHSESTSTTRSENSKVSNSEAKDNLQDRIENCKKCGKLHKLNENCPVVKVTRKWSTNEIPRFGKKGVTRGDQIGSTSSEQSTSSSENTPHNPVSTLPRRHRGSTRETNSNPNYCRHCYQTKNRSMRHKGPMSDLGQYDDYYLAAIQSARNHARHAQMSADSLSEFSHDSRQRHHHDSRYVPKGHPIRNGPDRMFVGEFGMVNFSPNGYFRPAYLSCESCSCSESGSCTGRRPRSFSGADEPHIRHFMRASMKARDISPCSCGHGLEMQNGRKVKFAERANSDSKKVPKKTDPIPSKESTSEDKTEDELNPKQEEAMGNGNTGGTKPKDNGNGLLGLYKTPQYPWEVEDWHMFMHKKQLEKKRRRALYMGIIALVIIIVIGLSAGLVMVWLRKTN